MFCNLRFLFPHIWFRDIHDIVQFRVLNLSGMERVGADIGLLQFRLERAGEADDACFGDVVR